MRPAKLLSIALMLAGIFFLGKATAQIKIGTNGANIQPSSLLELESANQGLLLPRMTDTVAINALNPPNGMLIYLTKQPSVGLYVRKVTGWEYLTGSLGGNGNFTSLTVSGAITAGSFSGPLTGNASSATTAATATNSLNVAVINDLNNTATVFPTFATITPGNNGLRTSNTKLSFVPSTGILTALGFSGPLTGNVTGTATQAIDATNAANTEITNDFTTNGLHYPTFVAGISGNLPQKTSSTNLTFNPSTGILTAAGFSGNLAGNSTTATNASTTTITDDIAQTTPVYPTFVTNTSGNWGQRTAGSRLSFIPSTGVLTAGGFTSTVLTGTAPFVVASSTPVANLTSTNAVNTGITDAGTIAGTAYPTFVMNTSGNLPQRVAASSLSFIPSTGRLNATSFAGLWNGAVISGEYGGTGVSNLGRTITLGGNLTTFGNNAITLTSVGATNVTLPTSGTLVAAISGGENLTFPLTAVGGRSEVIMTVTFNGAADGDPVSLGVPAALMVTPGMSFTAWVSALNTVTVRFTNNTGSTQTPVGTFNVKVFK